MTATSAAAPSTPPLLEARGLARTFGGIAALVDVDLIVHPGEVIGVVGPNGSGKTTLFNCLTRMEPVDAGRIFLRGADITDRKPFEVAWAGLARTFQSIRVYRNLSVLDNMVVSQRWGALRWRDVLRPSSLRSTERAEELLDFVTLFKHRHMPAGALSWGQQRLLEIGMALMPDPEIVLLDEAVSGVSPTMVEVIRERIAALNAEHGITILLIEHNVEVVEDLCGRIVVLDRGRKLADGQAQAVFEDADVIEAYFGRRGGDV